MHEELWLREVKFLAHDHPAARWQSQAQHQNQLLSLKNRSLQWLPLPCLCCHLESQSLHGRRGMYYMILVLIMCCSNVLMVYPDAGLCR
jgi:hypothetical protein